ncbi:hypothetical protein ANN_26045 [Periplaneta americana]|uniref:Reverse transcriptase domain-containing protein n=1 Tax=Periplaneta americana TaxID=6978 RepID=A0ABQ8S5A0_PERAM|nr:hypothetical protein ANN_26045 [Periplaneta americana]
MRTHTDGNRRLYRQLQQDVKNAINDFENRRRLRLATNLDTNVRDKPGTFWKTLKKLNGYQQPTYPLKEPEAYENDNPLTAAFTTHEVADAKQHTNNKAAGPDNIHNVLIRNYPDTAVEFLKAIYNANFCLGALPPRWKYAHVLLFPKPGKDLTNATNYRPIRLTATTWRRTTHSLTHKPGSDKELT